MESRGFSVTRRDTAQSLVVRYRPDFSELLPPSGFSEKSLFPGPANNLKRFLLFNFRTVDRIISALAGPDADDSIQIIGENLPVTVMSGIGRFHNGIHSRLFPSFIGYDNLQLDLRQNLRIDLLASDDTDAAFLRPAAHDPGIP